MSSLQCGCHLIAALSRSRFAFGVLSCSLLVVLRVLDALHGADIIAPLQEVRRVATEIDLFTAEAGIGVKDNPLEWWKARESRYPVLSQMARVYLCMPASSAPAERVFSAGTLVLTDKRRRLQDDRVAQLIFLKKNMSLYNKLKA